MTLRQIRKGKRGEREDVALEGVVVAASSEQTDLGGMMTREDLHKSLHASFLVPLVLLITACCELIAADPFKVSTPGEAFSFAAAALKGDPIRVQSDWERVRGNLERVGIRANGDNMVIFDAPAGRASAMVLGEYNVFLVTLAPAPGAAFGDAALAALMNKGERVDLSNEGDAIDITLRTEKLSKSGRTGVAQQTISFSLSGAVWLRTRLFISWDK